MRKKSPYVAVEPNVLQWLRESSGTFPEEISKRLNVSIELVNQWELGQKQPTFNQIKIMAKAYKRPSAAFFLPKPTPEPKAPQDFRKISGTSHPLGKKTRLAIRQARTLQAVSRELMQNLRLEASADVIAASLDEKPEERANTERQNLEISLEEQFQWKRPTEAFKGWRDAIEHKNIRVFQLPMELEELRGLTLLDTEPFAIVINSSDLTVARIFTLLHEYGHVLLSEQALCKPEEPTIELHGRDVERWCNNFAGALLLPAQSVEQDFEMLGVEGVRRIANRYRVSLSTVLMRLFSLGLISQDIYQREADSLHQKEVSELRRKELAKEANRGRKGVPSDKRAFRERGDVFVSLVLENAQKGYITHSDALDYLNVKMKHLKELTNPMS